MIRFAMGQMGRHSTTIVLRRFLQVGCLAAVCLSLSGCWGLGFSPDGKWLAFLMPTAKRSEDEGPNYQLATVKLSEGKIRVVADSRGADTPVFSPDGKSLGYLDEGGRLMVLNVATGKRRKVIEQVGSFVWEPNGKRIVALRSTPEAKNGEIDWIDVASGEVLWRQIPDLFRFAGPTSMAYLADRDAVVVSGTLDLLVVSRSSIKRLSANRTTLGFRVLPDGKSMVWATASEDRLLNLHRYEFASGKQSEVAFPAKVRGMADVEHVLGVEFNRDASQFVASYRKPGKDRAYASECVLVDVKSATAKTLMSTKGWMANMPLWSPTGELGMWTFDTKPKQATGTLTVTVGKKTIFKGPFTTDRWPD